MTYWSFIAAMRRQALGAAAFAAVVTGGPAHAQLRLHSASEEEATSALAADLDKARIAHLAALDAHRAYLVEALARDRTLLVQRELAERDAMLALVLATPKRDAAISTLSNQIDLEWAELAGNKPSSLVFDDFLTAARNVDTFEITLLGLRRHRILAIALFESKGGDGSYCDANGGGTVTFTQGADIPEAQGVSDTCGDLKKTKERIQQEYNRAEAASALIGDPDPRRTAQGEIRSAIDEAKEITDLVAAQSALVAVVKKQTKALDAYYQCELARTTIADAIRTDAAGIQKALDTLATGDPKTVFSAATFTSVWDTLRNTKVAAACADPAAPSPPLPPADPVPPAAAASGPSAQDILSVIAKLDKFAADDAILSQVRATALDIQGSALGEALVGLAAQPGDKPSSKTAQRALAALRIFGQLDKLYRASEGKMPDTAGVLVALADVRMRQATAKIEADRLAELDRLSRLRLVALRQRAVLLAGAGVQLKLNSDIGLSGALRRYAESVDRGTIPATVIANDMAKGRYLPLVDREKAVVVAGYDVLAPAAAQLQAYGKGGITADTIAQFLQAVGIGGIAVK